MKTIADIYKYGKGPSTSHTMSPEKAARQFLSRHPNADMYTITL